MHRILPFIFTITLACQSTSSQSESALENKDTLVLSDLSNQAIQFEAQITILNLWATWCKPCIAEMPALEAMGKQLPEGFQLLLASDEPLERQLKFINKQSLDLSFVQLKSSMEGLGVYALPTTLILDSKGNILDTMVGAREWDTPQQIEKITSYLK